MFSAPSPLPSVCCIGTFGSGASVEAVPPPADVVAPLLLLLSLPQAAKATNDERSRAGHQDSSLHRCSPCSV